MIKPLLALIFGILVVGLFVNPTYAVTANFLANSSASTTGFDAVEDTKVIKEFPSTNQNTAQLETRGADVVGSAEWGRTYIKWNITDFWDTNNIITITNVTMFLEGGGNEAAADIDVFNVSDYDTSRLWEETSITWNNQPCASSETSLNGSCNSTILSAGTTIGGTTIDFWDVTEAFTHLTDSVEDKSVTVVLGRLSTGFIRDRDWDRKENTADAPYLEIQFTQSDVIAPTIDTLIETPSSPVVQINDFLDLSVEFNATIIDETALDTVILRLNGTNFTVTTVTDNQFTTTQTIGCNQFPEFSWFANDTSGNENVSSTFTYNLTCLDTTSPVITGLVTEPSSPQSQLDSVTPLSVQFNATITDDVALDIIQFTFDSTTITPSQSGDEFFTTQSVECGTTNYQWFANDTSGNETTSSDSFVLNCQASLSSFSVGIIVTIIALMIGVGFIAMAGIQFFRGEMSLTTTITFFIIGVLAIVVSSAIIGINLTAIA